MDYYDVELDNEELEKLKLNNRKNKMRQKSKFKAIIIIVILLSIIVFSFLLLMSNGKASLLKDNYTVAYNAMDNLKYLDDVSARIEKLAKKDSGYNEIYMNMDNYPNAMLKSLVVNSELIDYVLGYKKGNPGEEDISLTRKELNSKHPLFMQWDKRWGYKSYGEDLLGLYGCGPTCLSMAVTGLTNKEVNPYEVSKYAKDNGFWVKGSGSSWNLISKGANNYGVSCNEIGAQREDINRALDNGSLVIAVMGPGHFTTSGHFIMIYGYNDNGYKVNDPNSKLRSERIWPYEDFGSEIKNIWQLYI